MSPCELARTTTRAGLSVLTITSVPTDDSSDLECSILFIFVPGYACRASDFAPLVKLLSQSAACKSARLVSVDLPGHGETPESVCAEPSVMEFARLVNLVRAEYSYSSMDIDVVLVGHSLGARIVLEAFIQDRKGVRGLVFVDGSHSSLRPRGDLERQQAVSGPKVGEENEQQRRPEREKALAFFEQMFSPLTPPEFRTQTLAGAKASMQYLAPLRRSQMMWDREKMDGAIRTVGETVGVRVLVLQSTDGSGAVRRPLTAREESVWMEFVKERVGDGEGMFEGVVVTGCGHFPHVDRPEEVAECLGGWLGRWALKKPEAVPGCDMGLVG